SKRSTSVATTSTTVPGAGPRASSRSFLSRLRDGDEIARLLTFLFAATVVLITATLVYQLWADSVLPRHKFGWKFLVAEVWDPVFDQLGALPFIFGTVVTSAVPLLIVGPAALGGAVFH